MQNKTTLVRFRLYAVGIRQKSYSRSCEILFAYGI